MIGQGAGEHPLPQPVAKSEQAVTVRRQGDAEGDIIVLRVRDQFVEIQGAEHGCAGALGGDGAAQGHERHAHAERVTARRAAIVGERVEGDVDPMVQLEVALAHSTLEDEAVEVDPGAAEAFIDLSAHLGSLGVTYHHEEPRIRHGGEDAAPALKGRVAHLLEPVQYAEGDGTVVLERGAVAHRRQFVREPVGRGHAGKTPQGLGVEGVGGVAILHVVGEAVIERAQARRRRVPHPRHLDRRRLAGEQHQPVVGAVAGQIHEDIDPVRLDPVGRLFVADRGDVQPVVEERTEAGRYAVLGRPGHVGEDLEGAAVEALDAGFEEARDGVAAQVAGDETDPQPPVRVAVVPERSFAPQGVGEAAPEGPGIGDIILVRDIARVELREQPVGMGVDVEGREGGGTVKGRDRLVQPADALQDLPAVDVGAGAIRIDLQSPVGMAHRVSVAGAFVEKPGEVRVGDGEVRIQFEGLFQGRKRAPLVIHHVEHGAEPGEVQGPVGRPVDGDAHEVEGHLQPVRPGCDRPCQERRVRVGLVHRDGEFQVGLGPREVLDFVKALSQIHGALDEDAEGGGRRLCETGRPEPLGDELRLVDPLRFQQGTEKGDPVAGLALRALQGRGEMWNRRRRPFVPGQQYAELVAGVGVIGGDFQSAVDVPPRLVETPGLAMRHRLGQEALGGTRQPTLPG